MDTTQYPSLPSLFHINARIARDSRRVEQIVEAYLDVVERLFRASISEDWVGVARATLQLAEIPAEKVGHDVIRQAKAVYQELTDFTGGFKKPRHLRNLLAACRELRMNGR